MTKRKSKGELLSARGSVSTVSIGILGVAEGSGVTHLCLMSALFLAAVMGKRVALVEMGDRECFRQVRIILENRQFRKTKKLINMISTFSQTEFSELSAILSAGYDYVVMDLGCNYEAVRQQFLMCQIKVVTGSLAWWKIKEYSAFLARTDNEPSRKFWAFLTGTAACEGMRYLKEEYGINVRQVPCEPDPFTPGGESLDFLYELTNQATCRSQGH